MPQNFWDLQCDFKKYNLFNDNGNPIKNKNMLVITILEI